MRAFENNVYFAVANMAGRDKVYSYFGHSNIVNFDGTVIAECSSVPDMVQYATLSLTAIRSGVFDLCIRSFIASQPPQHLLQHPPQTQSQQCPRPLRGS